MSVDAEIKRVQENVRAGIALVREESLRDGHLHNWTGAEYSEDTCYGCGMTWGRYLREVQAALARIVTDAGVADEEEELEEEPEGEPCSECGGSLADDEGWDGLCGECAEGAAENHDWVLTERHYVRTWHTEISRNDDGVETVTATYGGTEDFSDDGDGQMVLVCSDCDEERDAPDDIVWL